MSADLGTFEDLPITGHALKLVKTGDGLSKALMVSPTDMHAGDTIDLLIRAKAGSVNMKIDDEDSPTSWVREQVLSALTISVVTREFADAKIAEQVAAEAKAKEADERKRGIVKLPGMALDKGPLIVTDEFGVQIIGEADIAAARERGETVVETTPVIAEFNDDPDERRMWPDEFDKGDPRPRVGDVETQGTVTSLIDPTTGDVLDPHGAADVSHPAAAGDVDPALLDFLEGPVADVKARIAGQLSAQLLKGALDVELSGPNTPRAQVVNALKRRIEELEF